MTRGMFEDELVSLLRRPSHVCDNSHIPDSELEFAFAMGVVLTRDGIWNYQGIACVRLGETGESRVAVRGRAAAYFGP